MNWSSPGIAKPKHPEEVKISNVPKHLSNNSVSDRIEKLRKLEYKPPKSHESHDFRGMLKSKPASSEKIDYRSVLKHKTDNDVVKTGVNLEKKHSAGPELGTDFREILSLRKQSREEQVKLQNERKSNSFSGTPSKKDNSTSSIDYRSVLNRKRNSVPKEDSPVVNRDNFSASREKPSISVKQETISNTSPLKSEPSDNKSSSLQRNTVPNSASETPQKSKFLTPKEESVTNHQKIDERTPDQGKQSMPLRTRRQRDSPSMHKVPISEPSPVKRVEKFEPLYLEKVEKSESLHVEKMEKSLLVGNVEKSEPLLVGKVEKSEPLLEGKVEKSEPLPVERVETSALLPVERVETSVPPSDNVQPLPSQPPVLTDVMDEVDIENLLAARRQRRRQSPAHKDFIPPDHSVIVDIPVNQTSMLPESRTHVSQKPDVPAIHSKEESKQKIYKEEENSKNSKVNSENNVETESKTYTQEYSKPSAINSQNVMENKNEDFRTIVANRKNLNANNVRDSVSPNDKSESERRDILSDWRARRQQRNQDNREGVNGDVKSTTKLDSVAHESTKPKEETMSTRPALSKLNLNLNRNEMSSENGSVKTPENNSDDFRSILSRKRRTSNSFSKYDSKDNKPPSSPKTTDFRHVLTRHVSYVENRHRQPPAFNTRLKDKTVTEGDSVTMECHITGVPRPEITWTMNNNQIKVSK
jgi:hypothetical protein